MSEREAKEKRDVWIWIAGGLLGLVMLLVGSAIGGASGATVNAVQDQRIGTLEVGLKEINTKLDRLLERRP